MGKFVKIFLVASVVVLGAVFLYFSISQIQMAKENGVPGPKVTALGHVWETTLIVSEYENHSESAVHAIFEAPKSFDPQDPEITHQILIDLCNVVVDNAKLFDQGGLDLEQFDHVDVNLRIGKKKAFAFDPALFLKDGVCGNNFYILESDREETRTASNHTPQEEVTAVLQAWGVRSGGVKFVVGTNGRQIQVEYFTEPEFKRDLKDLNVKSLCILALMNMKPNVNMLVTEIDPSTYDQMVVKAVFQKTSLGGVYKSSKSGSVTFELENGKCGEVVR